MLTRVPGGHMHGCAYIHSCPGRPRFSVVKCESEKNFKKFEKST